MVVFLCLSLIMPNVKFYFLLVTGYILTIFWLTKSWKKTVVYAYWPLAIYYVGQLYVFRVIQPEELNHPLYPDGRSIYFKFTPLLILETAMLITWLVRMITEKIKGNWLIIILLIGVISRQISAMNGGIVPWWVQLGNTINDLSGVLWLWWVIDYLQSENKKEKIDFWKYFSLFLKTVTIIGSVLVIVQGIKGSGLGLVVEQSGILPYSGAGSDSGGWLVRPIGLWTHANVAAFSILSQLLAWVLIRFYKEKKNGLIDQKWLLLPIIALIWLQSRSVFLAIIPVLGWWGYFYKTEIKLAIKKVQLSVWSWIAGIGIMFLSAMVVVDRFWNSVTNFGVYSGWETRSRLISVAMRVFSHHFWWGVGSGNFIPVAFREDLSKIMRTFPESVHNGWILILVEQGVVGAIVWVIFLAVFVKKWWAFTKNNMKLRWFVLVMIISQSIVMMFQPFQDILTLGVIMGVLLLADEGNEGKKSI